MSENNFIDNLISSKIIVESSNDNETVYHLNTPCKFRISSKIILELKKNYKSDEEIGGILWAKPNLINDNFEFLVENVSFIRNAIEDKPRTDNRNKSNAYSFDKNEYVEIMKNIFDNQYLPVQFHTHPTKGSDVSQALKNFEFQTDTSNQDVKESLGAHTINDKKLILPRALIVGNDFSSDEIFIGIYNGLIAPVNFDESKKKIQQENLNNKLQQVANVKLSNEQKLGIVIGGALLLFVIIRYHKYSLPLILGLAGVVTAMLTNTEKIEEPYYFNRLKNGDANIYVPKLN